MAGKIQILELSAPGKKGGDAYAGMNRLAGVGRRYAWPKETNQLLR
jgi:hypothetical protein